MTSFSSDEVIAVNPYPYGGDSGLIELPIRTFDQALVVDRYGNRVNLIVRGPEAGYLSDEYMTIEAQQRSAFLTFSPTALENLITVLQYQLVKVREAEADDFNTTKW